MPINHQYMIYNSILGVSPLLQVAVAQRAVDELVGRPLQGQVITGLVERQVAAQHLHVLLLPERKRGGGGEEEEKRRREEEVERRKRREEERT